MNGVSVNGVQITEPEIAREVQYHPAGSLWAARYEATRALVVRALLLQQAERLGLGMSSPARPGDTDQVIRALTESQVPVPRVEPSDCRRYYDENPGRFRGPELFEASHILFAVGGGNESEVRAHAERVLKEVLSKPQGFEAIARVQSACPSGSSGGRLGQISVGETLPEFEGVLRTLEAGAIAQSLVRTRHGYHIVRLENRAAVSQLPFGAVEEKIRIYLRDREWRRSVRQYISRLAAEAEIRGFDLEAPLPPEPQGLEGSPKPGVKGVARQQPPGRRLPLLS